MPFNYRRTKRPREALLDLYIGKKVMMSRIGGSFRTLVEYLSLLFLSLTYPDEYQEGTVYGCQFAWGRHLLKSNAGIQRLTWSGRKSDCKYKSISQLDCETN